MIMVIMTDADANDYQCTNAIQNKAIVLMHLMPNAAAYVIRC
jgi:hypothetical protein